MAKQNEIRIKLDIDISNYLKKYKNYFKNLNEQLKKNNNINDVDKIKYIFENFDKNIQTLKKIYEINKIKDDRIKNLEKLHNNLLLEIQKQVKPASGLQKGGKKK
jgi:hypothetical protein